MRAFASDNYAGAHPEVLAAIAEANADHAVSYGADPWTAKAYELIRARFGEHAQPWLVFNGTAANVLSLGALTRSWECVVTPDTSHLHVDEAAAPERLADVKVLTVPTEDGRLSPAQIEPLLARQGDEHAPQVRVVSIANSTELGTVYDVPTLRAIADVAHANGLLVHIDGSRLANAASALGVEAVVFLKDPPPAGFAWLRKQHAQLASKMRFLSAQVVAMLEDDLYLRAAAHANTMASLLAQSVTSIPGITITRPVQANAVFATLPTSLADAVRPDFPFYTWDESTGEVRWMCSWDTTEHDISAFTSALQSAAAAV